MTIVWRISRKNSVCYSLSECKKVGENRMCCVSLYYILTYGFKGTAQYPSNQTTKDATYMYPLNKPCVFGFFYLFNPYLNRICLVICFFVSVNKTYIYIYIHFTDAFIQSDLQCIHAIHIFVSVCVPWESNPQPLRC